MNIKIVHFCYFQNTFPFVSMSSQTDDIGNNRRKNVMGPTVSLYLSDIVWGGGGGGGNAYIYAYLDLQSIY